MKNIITEYDSKKKIKSLFPLKDKNIYPAWRICYGLSFCKGNYICESKNNTTTRWGQHNNHNQDSKTVKHLNKNIQHSYNQTILVNAFNHTRTRNNLEAIFIALLRPSLNNHLKSNKLLLFRNSITQFAIQKFFIHCNKYIQYSSQRSFLNGKKNFLFNWYYSCGNADTFCLNRTFSLPLTICNLH